MIYREGDGPAPTMPCRADDCRREAIENSPWCEQHFEAIFMAAPWRAIRVPERVARLSLEDPTLQRPGR